MSLNSPEGASDVRLLVAHACRILGARGLAEDVLGHVSLRTGTDRLLVRCRGPREEGLLFTRPDDVREVDLDGQGADLGDWAVPNELPIHAEVLRARPDVDAVVHCHPPSVLIAGLEGVPLRAVFGAYHIPAARLALEGVPVYPRSVLVRRPELGREVAAALGDKSVLVMRGHPGRIHREVRIDLPRRGRREALRFQRLKAELAAELDLDAAAA